MQLGDSVLLGDALFFDKVFNGPRHLWAISNTPQVVANMTGFIKPPYIGAQVGVNGSLHLVEDRIDNCPLGGFGFGSNARSGDLIPNLTTHPINGLAGIKYGFA